MPHGEEHSNTLLVEVAGAPLADDVAALLVSGYVDDSSNVPDLFVLTFRDENASVLQRARITIGTKLRLSVQSSGPGGPVPLVSGEVTAVETEIGGAGVSTVVRGLDMSHRLFRGRRVEAYVNVTAADIARTVAQRAGIAAGRIDVRGPVLPHVAQDGVSDWDFLRGLADQTGAVLAVVDGALDFRAPTPATQAPSGAAGARQDPLVLERGVNLVSLRATVTSAGQVPEVEVRGWDVTAKRELVGVAPARTASAALDGVSPAGLASTFSSPRYVVPASTFGQQSQCDAAARALADHLAGGFAELDGVVRGNPQVRAGVAVTLVNVGKPFEGRYTLSATRHDFSADQGYLTSFTVSNASERSLYGVAAGAARSGPTVQGVVTAQVTDLKDPDGQGRVKVKFPVLSGTYESWWARTVQAGAGAGRGAVVLPEVGDEVLVAFGQSSFQQPFVLGGLYNGKDAPATPWSKHVGSTDGAVTRRAFVSRTGMLLELLESPDGEALTLSTNGGAQRITLTQKRDAGITITSEGPLTVTAKKDVRVTTTGGDVAVKGTRVAVTATGALELKGSQVTVEGAGGVEIKGATVKVAGDATAELSGGATTTVKGALVRIN
ncbi:VgrG-related protein [Cellulomonas aerilata]|uniref:Type IV secretion protein Rhs n=1 Tax=Cellulomonas aerilata TaxID=515326 RepID=A0A512DA86_9CELL|nr:VgrG-related protein [Cellulomonas aerilata]GEO33287.1 type IV secretion protein Rhs [Cellulomonas aerilata]